MLSACAWCPKTLEILEAEAAGVPVTHGICERHHLELLEEVRVHGSRPNQAVSSGAGVVVGY